ncbi:Pre-mRNA splicing factor PRP21 like protein-domain-containing protein [Microdochium trichocladiopsis]|uniref:Pre-mRNA splicing factor PRP21 like protein-domain-containing protein n=1 Tax=Microdochium trichocladiopsis TaxID=1682393 RepID=A0A9P8XXF3_9PEZI|nr:Pre-mRNA splicing factor PRP21 like protein-domain-containing protein [Microdochium trichocladiopsis]KAH7018267.1 Pre-mRNA splicing factor PRP21 like protein-domain-containing protein [Microdochium trichocladiopsis]
MATATNGDGAAEILDSIKPPQGVVLPPKEFRTVLEKTAGYVARNGLAFEERIREKEKNNPKLSFLNPADPYNPYYLWRLSEIKEGRGNAIAAGRAGEATAAAEEEKPKGPPKPPDFQFSARMPNISAQDLDVVKLTALFVAKNGRQFMTTLSQKEAGNYQFDFLRPNHSLHNFFQHLIDQYSLLLRSGGVDGEGGKVQQQLVSELQHNVEDRYHILTRAKQRAEWLKHQEGEKQKKEEEEEAEKLSYAQIDWHDFVVVETVVFTDADDQAALPPPTSLSELQYASLEQKGKASVSANLRIEEAFPSDEDSLHNNYAAQPNHNLPYHPASAPQAQYPVQNIPQAQAPYQMAPPPRPHDAQEDEENQRIREREEARIRMQMAQAEAKGGAAPMKIKENYVPKAAQRAANRQGAGQMALCPNCKQQIPLNELEEHMRIELLDPSWKEQKAKAEQRYATTNLTHADMANNLKRLASNRVDIFDGTTGQPITEEEAARRKRIALNSYDGNPEGRSQAHMSHMQNVNVDEQIARIHQRFASRDQGQ